LLFVACEAHDFGDAEVCVGSQAGPCDIFTAQEWGESRRLSPGKFPMPKPASPTNGWADDATAAALGEKLFFDECFSGSNGVEPPPRGRSCATCHRPDASLQETFDHPDGKRNTPSLIDVADYEWWPWDGRTDSLWSMNLIPTEGEPLSSDRLTVARRMHGLYGDEYRAIFCPGAGDGHCHVDYEALPGDWARPPRPEDDPEESTSSWSQLTAAEQDAVNRTYANYGKALEAYLRRLRSGPTPFDAFVAGDPDAISESAKRGLKLFVGEAGCIECHEGPSLSDDDFHVIGLPGNGVASSGRKGAINEVLGSPFNTAGAYSDDPEDGKLDGLEAGDRDYGAFRTKHLRGVSATGRYMHAGILGSLEDVVRYYVDRGLEEGSLAGAILDPALQPLDLTEDDIGDLVAFLESLDIPEVSQYITTTPEQVAAAAAACPPR
jgi:cytochrome c peroxidase